MQRGLPERRQIKDVKKVIAVSSAKGGVGKSTIAGSKLLSSLKSTTLIRSSEPSLSVRPPRSSKRYPRHRHLRTLDPYTAQPLWRATII